LNTSFYIISTRHPQRELLTLGSRGVITSQTVCGRVLARFSNWLNLFCCSVESLPSAFSCVHKVMWFVSTGSSGAAYVVSAYRPVEWIALAWDANLALRLATFELIQLDKVPQNCASRNIDCWSGGGD